jgi:zinc transporter, ZIP family
MPGSIIYLHGALPTSVGYAAIGGASVIAGTVIALNAPLSTRVRSLVQHGAAGTALAGLVVDVLSKLLARPEHLLACAAGMLIGLAAMLVIRARTGEAATGMSLVVTIVADILIDGVLIGLSAALGAATGLLFAIALAPEMSLLGMTAAAGFGGRWSRPRVAAAAVGIAAGITAAGALGWLVSRADAAIATGVLAVGASVIIYLILEELLRDAHQTDMGLWEVAVLFGCFLPFFLAGIALR